MSNAYGPCASSDDVLQFIEDFVHQGPEFSMKSVFSHGGCYWFASTLCKRFYNIEKCNTILMYSPVLNHFAAFIETEWFDGQSLLSSMFDVKGRVLTFPEDCWVAWTVYKEKEPYDALSVIHNCVMQDGTWEQPEGTTESEAREEIREQGL